MDFATIKSFLLWGTVVNIAFLMLWFLFLVFGYNWIYKMHSRWYTISKEQFGAIHYAGVLFFKTGIFFFFLVPYLALCIIGK